MQILFMKMYRTFEGCEGWNELALIFVGACYRICYSFDLNLKKNAESPEMHLEYCRVA